MEKTTKRGQSDEREEQQQQPQLCPNFLKDTLFGAPITKRDTGGGGGDTIAALDVLIQTYVSMLESDHGRSVSFCQSERELYNIKKYSSNSDVGASCKRAVVLFAVWKEPDFANMFCQSDPELVEDLRKRVLPLIGPLFVENLGQRPDSFVSLCSTLCLMYTGEKIAGTPACSSDLPLPLPLLPFNDDNE